MVIMFISFCALRCECSLLSCFDLLINLVREHSRSIDQQSHCIVLITRLSPVIRKQRQSQRGWGKRFPKTVLCDTAPGKSLSM
jgi:hypothetical protein